MKNKYILSAALVTLFSTVAANAQEGFGTNSPDPSSVIEMKSAKRGVLIPRVDLTATNLAGPVIAPANSLMVYNKATAGTGATGVTPGFYYWFVDPSNDPTKDRWIRITNAEDIIKGSITSSDLNVTGGTDATFTNVTLDIKNGAVTTVKIAPKAVTEDKMLAPALSTGTPATIRIPIAQNDGTVAYGAFPATGVTGDNLTPYTNTTTDVVPSIDIPNGGTGAVLVSTSLRVANGGITTGKLANDAVTSGKILDGEVKLTDLDANSVDSSKIVNESILSEDIKDGEITSADIKDLTITGADIAGQTITVDKLVADGTNDAGKVATVNSNGSVTYQTISTDATNVTNAKNLTAGDASVAIGGISNGVGATLVPVSVMVAANGITTDKIKDGDVKLADLDANSVDSSKIANETILSEDIKDGEITSADIKDLTITGADIASNTITAGNLNGGTAPANSVATTDGNGIVTFQPISTANLADRKDLTAYTNTTTDVVPSIEVASGGTNAVLVATSLKVKDGGITTGKLAADAVDNSKLADNAVQTENIAVNAVETSDIKDGAVTVLKLNSGSALIGKVAKADGVGGVVFGDIPSSSVTGANMTPADASVAVTGGTGATLVPVTVGVAADGITNDKIADNAVQTENIKDGEVKLADLASGSVDSSKIVDESITSADIKDGEVTSADIKDLTITGADIAGQTITVNKLDATGSTPGYVATVGTGGVVTYAAPTADVSNITNGKNLTAGDTSVTIGGTALGVGATLVPVSVMVAVNGITTDKIKDGEVGTADLGADAVTNAKLADNAVQTENIKDKNVTAIKLVANAADDNKVATAHADGTVTYESVSTANLADKGSLTSPILESPVSIAITGGTDALLKNATISVADGGITTVKLANNAVTSGKIADGEVKLADLDANSVDSSKIVNESILSEDIKDGEVKTADLGADAVTNAKLADDAVQTENIKDKNVTANKLVANAADANKVATAHADGTVTYEAPTADAANITNGKALSSTDLNVSSPEGATALLKAVTIDIKAGAVTTTKIADKNVTPAKMQPGNTDQVLATNSAGTDVVWVNKSTLAIEPWLIQAATPTVQGSTYADNLTTNGTVAIRKAQVLNGAILDVAGAVRGGVNAGTVGLNSAAFGNSNTAAGASAFAAGASNTASGASAVALGQSNTVSAANATAIGQTNTASGNGSTVGGFTNTASTIYETVFGRYNAITTPTTGGATTWNAADPLFQIGNGSAVGTRNNALTILKSGFTGLGLTGAALPADRLHVAAGNVRISDINTTAGATSDKIVVADTNGVLKTISALSAIGAGDITGGTEITVGNGTDSAFKDVTLGIATNAITNAKMADDAIGSAEIINNSITVDDIGTAAVGTDELVADAVTTGKILNGTILGEDISTKTITADKLDATGSTPGYVATVGAGGIVTYAAPTADAANISNGQALTAADGTSATIDVIGGSNALLVATSLRVKDNSITNLKLNSGTAINGFVATANGSGGVAYLAPSVNTTNISNAKDLTNGGDTSITIGGAANGVGTLLKDASVSITNLGVTNGKIGPDAITTDKIAADAVQTSDIKDKNVTAAKLDATGITAGYVATANSNGTVTYQQVSTTNLANKGSLTNPTGETPVSITIAGGNNALLSNAQISVANGGVTAAKLTSGTAAANTVATSNGSGVVTYQAITPAMIGSAANLSGAADATPSIEVASGGTNAVLVATTLRVKDGGVTAAKLTSGTAAANTVATSNGSGVVTYQAISPAMIGGTSNLTAADATPSIEVVGGTNAVLSTTSLRVKDGGITSTKILDGTIAAVDMATPGNDKVLTSGSTGTVTWIDKSTLTAEPWQQQGSATAANTNTQNIYQQGNVGIGFTSADPASGSALDVKAGTVRVRTIGAVANAGAAKDKVVVADNTGVLKTVNAAMSKIFYMPAITFDTSVNGTYTKNLYQEYVNQFTGAGNPTLVSSTGAAAIPYYLDPNELYYYVTYYDNTVFTGLSISATGVLTYTVTGPGSPASYMNIVFVVK